LIEEGGNEGRVLKATVERWFGGHTHGSPPSWSPNQDLEEWGSEVSLFGDRGRRGHPHL